MTIAVTGGNGEFGRAVLKSLAVRTTEPIVGTVRDLAKVVPAPGVDYRPGDFDDPAALRAGLGGVDSALINATFFGADPARRLPRVTAALRAAADAGVSRIVLTSWSDLDNATVSAVQDYKDLEAAATNAGPAVTILRMAYGLADALARDVVWGKASGELVAPAAHAAVTPAAVADLAEAAAAVLAEPSHNDLAYELTGPTRSPGTNSPSWPGYRSGPSATTSTATTSSASTCHRRSRGSSQSCTPTSGATGQAHPRRRLRPSSDTRRRRERKRSNDASPVSRRADRSRRPRRRQPASR